MHKSKCKEKRGSICIHRTAAIAGRDGVMGRPLNRCLRLK